MPGVVFFNRGGRDDDLLAAGMKVDEVLDNDVLALLLFVIFVSPAFGLEGLDELVAAPAEFVLDFHFDDFLDCVIHPVGGVFAPGKIIQDQLAPLHRLQLVLLKLTQRFGEVARVTPGSMGGSTI